LVVFWANPNKCEVRLTVFERVLEIAINNSFGGLPIAVLMLGQLNKWER
jgi:hypothetical protein